MYSLTVYKPTEPWNKNKIVWQKSMDFVTEVYKVSKQFPKDEIFGL